jgi:hypothetical protein
VAGAQFDRIANLSFAVIKNGSTIAGNWAARKQSAENLASTTSTRVNIHQSHVERLLKKMVEFRAEFVVKEGSQGHIASTYNCPTEDSQANNEN